ncbi:MAG: hypothetical protein ABEJ48_02190 [Halobacteriales archaeon]
MADVGRPVGTTDGQVSDRDRGQLILVGGLALAVTFVALALVLNTAIYTENLATRGSDLAGGAAAIEFTDAAVDGIGGAIEPINHNHNDSHETLASNLTTAVDDWSTIAGQHAAFSGRSANVSVAAITNGTRIEQTNRSREFTNASKDATDWTLVEDVEHTREFRMNVSDDKLETDGPDAFNVTVTDGTTTWWFNVTEDAVFIDNGTITECSTTGSSAWINVTAGQVNGTECSAMRFAEGISTPYRIEFKNGNNAEGTYTLIVDNSSLAPSPTGDYETSGGSPFAEHAIYSTTIRVTVVTDQLRYASNRTVAPGEPDE